MRAALRLPMLAAVLAAGVGAASVSAAGSPRGTAAEQTHPSVLPHTGRARTRFTARLTLAEAPGHSGVLATDYRLALSAPRTHTTRRCLPVTPMNIDSGAAHQVVRIPLSTPARGWCSGRYTLTVFLQRGPYCPAPTPGKPPPPCPEFATQELDVGHATFDVAGRR